MRLKIVEQGCVAHSIGEPMGTNGRAMVTQGDPWGPWGAKNTFLQLKPNAAQTCQTNPTQCRPVKAPLKPASPSICQRLDAGAKRRSKHHFIKTAPVKRSICQRLGAARKLTGDSVTCSGGNTDRRWRFRFESAQLRCRLLPIPGLERGLIGTNSCCGVFGKRRPPLNSERLKQ